MEARRPSLLTDDLLAEGVRHLCALDPCFGDVVLRHGPPSLRAMPPGTATLLNIVTEQFLSLRAAHAIWLRIEARLSPFSSDAVLACPVDELMRLGLSGAKARSFHGIAARLLSDPDYISGLTTLPDDEARARLVALPGVGPWTADIYLLVALQRSDVWPAGDLALRQAATHLFSLREPLSEKTMRIMGSRFSPWRAVAARLLWSHYRGLKGLGQAK